MSEVFVHDSAIVDVGARIGDANRAAVPVELDGRIILHKCGIALRTRPGGSQLGAAGYFAEQTRRRFAGGEIRHRIRIGFVEPPIRDRPVGQDQFVIRHFALAGTVCFTATGTCGAKCAGK